MSSPLRSGTTALLAAVYVSATAMVFFWAVDLAIVAGVESLLAGLSVISAAWADNNYRWDAYAALILAFPLSAYAGTALFRHAYRVERQMTDA